MLGLFYYHVNKTQNVVISLNYLSIKFIETQK